MSRPILRTMLLALAFAAAASPATAQIFGGTEIRADCSVVSQGDIADSAIQVVCGMRNEQVVELVRLAASPDAGDRAALMAGLDALVPASSRLRVEAIAKFFELLGEAPVEPAQLADRFADLAERHRRLLEEAGTLRVADPEVQAKRDAAYAALDVGDHDAARALLDEARRIVRGKRETLARMLADQQREEAALVAEQAAIERARLRYRDAAALYREAADLLPPIDVKDRWANLVRAAVNLTLHKPPYGDPATLQEAIVTYSQAFALVPRAIYPEEWGETAGWLGYTLSLFGNALRVHGHVKDSKVMLERAVRTYEFALEELTREGMPRMWATIQNSLGNALQNLSKLEPGTAKLERAVEAYELALLEIERERETYNWISTQTSLGNALSALGRRQGSRSILKRAIEAYKFALEKLTRESDPVQWAMIQSYLGDALRALGARESSTAALERSAQAYELALEEWTRERMPGMWAETQSNLGNALAILGDRQRGTAALERAVQAYEAALLEWTRARAPFQWAWTQENVAIARLEIGRRRGDAGELWAALVALGGALEVYRAGKDALKIEHAELLRADIMAALDDLDG